MTTIFRLTDIYPTENETKIGFVQEDDAMPGWFLIGLSTALVRVPLLAENNTNLELLVGDIETEGYNEGAGTKANFNGLKSIIQLSSGYIVSDSGNDCLRLIENSAGFNDKAVWRTTTYAGVCKQKGTANGHRTVARFHHPAGLLRQKDAILIADCHNDRVRRLDLVTGDVTTVYESNNFKPSHLALTNNQELYATVGHGILQVKNRIETWIVGWHQKSYERHNGQFSEIGFSYPKDIVWLDDSKLLIADAGNCVIKLLDLNLKQVRVVCSGRGRRDGSIQNCQLYDPTSFAILNDVILISETSQIRQLQYRLTSGSHHFKL